MNPEREEAVLDLLIKQAIYGLTDAEQQELNRLEESGKSGDAESFEITAAVLSMPGLDTKAELPKNLEARILADAERFFDELEPERTAVPAVGTSPAVSRPWFGWLGWAAAAAACIALAINVYVTRGPQSQIVQQPSVTPTPAREVTPAEQRRQLMQSAPDLVQASWSPGNVADVKPSGDLVWSDARQTGYMRLEGLPVNDPTRSTYQLWIFDETQDDKTPIDGGTFDVTSEGELIVPINAKLNPRNTKMFAITVEKPGGVVVSKREKIVALAKRET